MEYISQEGFEKLKKELQELKTAKRKEIARRLEHAKSLGDLSENAEYQEAKEEQSLIEAQILELEETIRNAVIISSRTSGVAGVGSLVRVSSSHGEETFRIVGSEEANPMEGRISNESPLGKAFLGQKQGNRVEVATPGGSVVYKILSVE
jgi:transcription elongation factor GreA